VYHLCLALSLCHIILSSLCHWSAIHEHGSTVQWNINSQLSLNVLVLIDHNFHLHDHYCILVHYLELGECRTLWGKCEQAAHTSITGGWFGKVAECEQDQIDRQTRVLLYSASTIMRRWYCIAGLPTVVITNVCWDIFSHNRPQSCNSIYHYSYFPLIRLTDSQRMPKEYFWVIFIPYCVGWSGHFQHWLDTHSHICLPPPAGKWALNGIPTRYACP